MKKGVLKKIEDKLKKEKVSVEALLKGFAKKDKELKGDWNTIYPSFNGVSGGGVLEREADEFQEYESKLDVEHILELKLRDINLALEKIRTSLSARTLNASHLKKGKYGVCEGCGKKISQKRLKISPEARLCLKCRKYAR